ncbi:TrmB family transcriptional regulator [Streptomyces sp. NTH33]|uniref:helix-turn-helix domain-containing protein n=1 Tax=Streptomyces sp. NTH33 TaxID=1735453 RepID=UPI000DA9B689|nr:helix-turn-helix domain-containing protein [Streptomyces sp. NTH33]PZG92049.1 TrmB family transcriptional regulator [Streptomyces sp. NTH33]
MFETASLDSVEVRAYRTLVRVPEATPSQLARSLGLSGREAAALLDTLEAKGLVSRAEGSAHRFRASPPDLALGPLLLSRQQELQAAQSVMAKLTEEYHSEARRRGAGEAVETVTGAQAMARTFDQLQRGARGEILALCKPPNVAVPSRGNDTELEVLASGVRYRAVYERSALEVPPEVYRIREFVGRGEQARVAAEVPVKMVVADRELAMLVSSSARSSGAGSPPADPSAAPCADPSAEPSALLIRPGALLDALVAFFESLWAGASPLVLTEDGLAGERESDRTPAPEDLLLLSLLLTGLTDTAIAGQLGTSLRTVQRRIRDLIEFAGVRTRMQLAWEAARRGWL